MSSSDGTVNNVDELLGKTTDRKDIVKLKDIYEMVKSSEMYLNMNKEDKRKLNYKTFCSKLESNLFLKKYVGETFEKTKVLKCFKMKDELIEDIFFNF